MPFSSSSRMNAAEWQIPPRSVDEFRRVDLVHFCQSPSATFCLPAVMVTQFPHSFGVTNIICVTVSYIAVIISLEAYSGHINSF